MTSHRNKEYYPKYIVAGRISRDFVVPFHATPKMDFIGGSAAFAAAGLALWDQPVGILTRIGEDYPLQWMKDFASYAIDTRGVKILPESLDLRSFYGYTAEGVYQTQSPVGLFADIEYPYPLALLNYKPEKAVKDDLHTRWPTSPISTDIPVDYLDATSAHLCLMDYLTQSLLQSVFHSGEVRTITLEANSVYMMPEYWREIPNIVSGLTAFMADEGAVIQLFRGRSSDPLEMAAGIGSMGCELTVIRLNDGGKFLYQHSSRKKWLIPDYPVRKLNVHSSRHAFGGGFLAGYMNSYDPVMATLYGNISEAMACEGLHPLDLFSALPGLAQTRLQVLRGKVESL